MTDSPNTSFADYRGARGSNAGDNFHELWALQRALDLLYPGTTLRALTVERVETESPADRSDAVWDGVDCTLYFGGESLESADKIEIIQLKYSGSEPKAPWTLSRLTRNTRATGNNSILRRLAIAFMAARRGIKPGAQITVRLISNQPVAPEVVQVLSAQKTPAASPETDEGIKSATGLCPSDLIAFMAALDLSGCGSVSRFAIRDAVVETLTTLGTDEAWTRLRELRTQIRDLMLPEAARELITTQRVLGWFGVANVQALFPAPTAIKKIEGGIDRQCTKDLLAFVTSPDRIALLHGPAGCGKTTTFIQLSHLLPEHSAFLHFDCYGGGRYAFSNDLRHLPQHAFLQIANDLSLQLRIPFFLTSSSANAMDIRRFLMHVNHAADILKHSHPGALIIIGIDAADNSVSAALSASPALAPTPCFVHELARADLASLPDNVKFVFSSRTARKETLRLPQRRTEIECGPFLPTETNMFVRSQFGTDLSDDWIEQFHALSNAIPRVQTHAIQRGAGSPEATLNALRPGKGLADILEEMFQEASRKIGDANLYHQLLSALAVLPSPAPLNDLASIANTSEGVIHDFVNDIHPVLRIDGGGIVIADEDVQNFIRERGEPSRAEMQRRVCDHFSKSYRSDPYAATHYADLLVAAGRAEQLLPLIERDLVPAGIADPIVRREVQVRRLRLGLYACRSAVHPAESLKVILLAGEAIESQSALIKILKENPDLAVSFARDSLVRLILSDPDNAPAQGSVLAHDAARAARMNNRVEAREQLHYYRNWLDRRKTADDQHRHSWNVTLDDILATTEAALTVTDAKRAIAELRRWSPRIVPLIVGQRLALALLARGKADLVRSVLDQHLVEEPWTIATIVPLAMAGETISRSSLEKALSALRRRLVPQIAAQDFVGEMSEGPVTFIDLILSACEIGLSRSVDKQIVKKAIALLIDFDVPLKRRVSHTNASLIDMIIRAWLLSGKSDGVAKSIDQLLDFLDPPETDKPDRPRQGKKAQPKKRDEDLARNVRTIFPVYDSAYAILSGKQDGPAGSSDPISAIKGISPDEYQFDRDPWSRDFRLCAARCIIRLLHQPHLDAEALFQKAASIVQRKFPDPFATQLLPLYRYLLVRPKFQDFVLRAITKHAAESRNAKASATERVDAFIHFSRLISTYSEHDAAHLFADAVAIAQEIDREAFEQVGATSSLAVGALARPKDERDRLATLFFRFMSDVAVRMQHEEHFPWDDAVLTLTRLHPPGALAAIGRWADEGLRAEKHSLQPFIRESLRSGVLSPEQATGLLVLADDDDDYTTNEIVHVAVNAKPDVFEHVCEQLALDCLVPYASSSSQKLMSLLVRTSESCERTFPSVQWLKDTIEFLDELAPTESPKKESQPFEDKQPLDISGRRFAEVAAIEGALREARALASYFSARNLFARMREATQPGDRFSFLEALTGAQIDRFYENDRAETILDAMREWAGFPSVQRWRRDKLPDYIVANFLNLARWLRQGADVLPRLLDASDMAGAKRCDVLIRGIEATELSLGSRATFGVARLIANCLGPDERWDVLTWYVNRLSERASKETAYELATADLPAEIDAAVGRFIFALLSDIDTRVRWRAAHAMRRLAKLRADNSLLAVFNNYHRSDDTLFRSPRSPFYSLAARLWALISAARIAVETPRSIGGAIDQFVAIALDESFPHVLIRRYAKNAVIALLDAGVVTLPDQISARIEACNIPADLPRARGPGYGRGLDWNDTKDRRFHFDSMDTLPYWYSPLMRLFPKVSGKKFLDLAETWVVDRWSGTRETYRWDEEPRKARHDDRDWRLWHNGHGGMPVIERYSTYLEWHAMFVVAGELIRTEPLVRREDHYEGYEQWVAEYLISEPPTWLADRRDPIPLEPSLWRPPLTKDRFWLREVGRSEFISAIVPRNAECDSSLTVHGDWTAAFPTREVNTSVMTALVSPKTASALVRALQTAQSPYDYLIPNEADEQQIGEPGYRLVGWLSRPEHPTYFDARDPLRGDISPLVAAPGRAATKFFQLVAGPHPIREWQSSKLGFTAMDYLSWDDLSSQHPASEVRRLAGTHGYRLRIRADQLASFLRSEGMDLIAKIVIERRVENEYRGKYDWESKTRKTFVKVLLLRSSGAIEDITGRIGSWPPARGATRSSKKQ